MTADDIRKIAVKNGMIELNESCKKLIEEGVTDISEYLGINVE